MTPLLAARRQHLSAAYALHSRSKSVRFRTPPLPRLISPLWQGTASLCFTNIALLVLRFAIVPNFVLCIAPNIALRQAASAAISQSVSVVDPRAMGQEIRGIAYRAGKSDTGLRAEACDLVPQVQVEVAFRFSRLSLARFPRHSQEFIQTLRIFDVVLNGVSRSVRCFSPQADLRKS